MLRSYCSVSPDGFNPQVLQCLGCRDSVDCISVVSDCQEILEICSTSALIPYLVSDHNFVRRLASNKYETLQVIEKVFN